MKRLIDRWQKVDKRALLVDLAIVGIVIVATLAVTTACVKELRKKDEELARIRAEGKWIDEKREETTRTLEELRPAFLEALSKLPEYEEPIYDERSPVC